MAKYCTECGKGLQAENKVCIHCGTPVEQVHQNKSAITETPPPPVAPKVEKAPMSKQKKITYSVIATMVILLIGISMWANHYQSKEAVYKRYEQAVTDGDAKRLKSVMVHADGTGITEVEAKAYLDLVLLEGPQVTEGLYEMKEHGKFLLLFTAHKLEVVDQYLVYDQPVAGVELTFNGEKATEETGEDAGEKVYGPFVPGLYTVTAAFSNEQGDVSVEEEMSLRNNDGYSFLTMDIPVANIQLTVTNHDKFLGRSAHVLFGEEKFELDESGESEWFGPVIMDESQTAQVVVAMPWGEMKSADIILDEPFLSIEATLISEDYFDDLVALLVLYGEEYVEAQAKKDKAVFTVFAPDKLATIDDDYFGTAFYSGKFMEVEALNEMDITADEATYSVSLLARFHTEEATYFEADKVDLQETSLERRMEFLYDEQAKAWLIVDDAPTSTWESYEEAVKKVGSKKTHKPDKAEIKKKKKEQSAKIVEEEMEQFMYDYYDASVVAINERDFAYMIDYVTESGPRKKEARDYIDYLASKGIYEEFHEMTLEDVKEIEDNVWEVTTTEDYVIIFPDESKERKYRTINIVKFVDGNLQVDEFIDTNLID